MSGKLWGPTLLSPSRTRFRIWAPACTAMTLETDQGHSLLMDVDADGWFETSAPVGAGARYRFRLPDGTAVPDPASRAQADSVHGWSLVVDPGAYRWRHDGWQGRPWKETVLYEIHPGLAGGFTAVREDLERIARLGLTAIELMPVAAVSGTRNWGYDGVLPYAPAHQYGSPDDLRALIDDAHGLGLMVFLDVVYNHFGPDGNYLPVYAPLFFDEERHTPWGGGIAFSREEVARFFIDNARMWLEEYRFDGLRLDAVHAIGDIAFLDRLAHEVRAHTSNRHVHLVLENERNDAQRLSDKLFDAQWNDDFHNVLHVLLTGETHAYYADFADNPAAGLARCLKEGFIYQGQPSPHQDGRLRGTPSAQLPPIRFVSFLQNHDQVGNRALGERLIDLTTPEKLRAAIALLLIAPQIPLLFMGEVEGSHTPFLFFTDFHDELADSVREGRRKEFAASPAFSDARAREQIPDPNDVATFEQSVPVAGTGAWPGFYQGLLSLRHAQIMPHLDDARSLSAEALGEGAVVARWQLAEHVLTIAINLGDTPVALATSKTEPLRVEGAGIMNDLLQPASLVAWLD